MKYKKLSQRMVIAMLIILVIPMQVFADASHVKKDPILINDNGYEIELYVNPDPLKTGKTKFELVVRKDQVLVTSDLQLEYEMDESEHQKDAHGGHGDTAGHDGPIHIDLPYLAEHEMHSAVVEIDSKGLWNFNLLVAHGDTHDTNHTADYDEVHFQLDVLDAGPNLIFLAMLGNIMAIAMVSSTMIQKKKEATSHE
ncbi:hypothetical protein BHU72_10085 [Desulfuribacillus stibiiarsenatis]|uniref:YtkA-like domain-containing protein n=1 Tax=Desulfuribacillus stibiiarsenatis TaxID=1390249 RepID=A0A1E5L8X7_9FIRM|nr:hypothetical protein [Desulfuribacillus stibiiarsenatis]OEH86600.1 hypothetical protein BHU72_10085 [Desulfuribacillus stibiiarsenatis]